MMVKQALIVYYSQFNNTTKLAKLIQDATKAPALRLHVADSVYPNNMEATGRIYQKQLTQHQLPTLTNSLPKLNQYDVILVGGPVWNDNVAAPVIEFLKTIQGYQGLIAPFSTAWSDSDHYQKNFVKWAGRLQVTDGFHITTHGSRQFKANNLAAWLRKL
ncbi:flavodoxin family protein [Limosilactobacillus mucosae]|uniref:flavodoxin family protein n=1 Tax=Limosilactobacillus mucosae TaxID=97478 RepID=UPI00399274A3